MKQEEEEKEIVVEVLLNSSMTELVMSEEFVRKHRFRRIKLERPIYIRNVNGTLNYIRLIVKTVRIEFFFKGYKERRSINVIRDQIVSMPQPRD